jgi:TfoX/Sxy family transcriptional regulator of competence genes
MPGMSMPPGDPEVVRQFQALVPDSTEVEVRKMFGHLAAFARGNLFFGTFGPSIFVRLGEEERARALALPGAETFAPMAGRPMREYIVLPGALWAKPKEARVWVDRSLAFALALPAKKKTASPPRSKAR